MTDATGPRPYRLLDDIGDVDVPAGTSLLVVAPEPEGRDLVLRALEQGLRDGEHVLALTSDAPTGSIVGNIEREGGTTPGRVRVIDSQTGGLGVTDDDPVVVQDVDTPRNLTDIGIGFKNALDEFAATDVDRVRFGLLSLTVIMSYVDRETVYRFCQTLTRGLDGEDALGLFLLNVNAHDRETVNTLRRAFDGTVEVRSGDDGPAVRVSGVDGVPEEWLTPGD